MPGIHEERLAELIDWLSEPGNPSVRYLTLRHLLDKAGDEPDVQAARSAIAQSQPVRRVMACQSSVGCWGDPESPYLPKYKASYWTLMMLGYLHLSPEDVGVQKAVEYLLRFQQPCGGFAECGEEGACREYEIVARRRRASRRNLPGEDAFVRDYIHQMTLSCLTGNVTAALLRLGYADDPRVGRAVDWLVDIQNTDGGWLCPYWKAHDKDKHSCFYGTICPLEAFAEIPDEKRSSKVQEAASRGAEFLLMHRLYKADHHDFAVINPNWLKPAFPWFYRYDILRGLWVLARLGFRDERMGDALAVLREKQTVDGRWVLESTPSGRMRTSFGKKGKTNKWITLHALWVHKEIDGLG